MKLTQPSYLTPIGPLVEKSLRNLGLAQKFTAYPIWQNWQKLMGSSIASNSEPQYLRDQTLVVSVANSVWIQELQMQKKQLLAKINQLSLQPPVMDIRFKIKD